MIRIYVTIVMCVIDYVTLCDLPSYRDVSVTLCDLSSYRDVYASKLTIMMFCRALVVYMFFWIDLSNMNYRYRPLSTCFRPDCAVFRLPILFRSFSVPAFRFRFRPTKKM